MSKVLFLIGIEIILNCKKNTVQSELNSLYLEQSFYLFQRKSKSFSHLFMTNYSKSLLYLFISFGLKS